MPVKCCRCGHSVIYKVGEVMKFMSEPLTDEQVERLNSIEEYPLSVGVNVVLTHAAHATEAECIRHLRADHREGEEG